MAFPITATFAINNVEHRGYVCLIAQHKIGKNQLQGCQTNNIAPFFPITQNV